MIHDAAKFDSLTDAQKREIMVKARIHDASVVSGQASQIRCTASIEARRIMRELAAEFEAAGMTAEDIKNYWPLKDEYGNPIAEQRVANIKAWLKLERTPSINSILIMCEILGVQLILATKYKN